MDKISNNLSFFPYSDSLYIDQHLYVCNILVNSTYYFPLHLAIPHHFNYSKQKQRYPISQNSNQNYRNLMRPYAHLYEMHSG